MNTPTHVYESVPGGSPVTGEQAWYATDQAGRDVFLCSLLSADADREGVFTQSAIHDGQTHGEVAGVLLSTAQRLGAAAWQLHIATGSDRTIEAALREAALEEPREDSLPEPDPEFQMLFQGFLDATRTAVQSALRLPAEERGATRWLVTQRAVDLAREALRSAHLRTDDPASQGVADFLATSEPTLSKAPQQGIPEIADDTSAGYEASPAKPFRAEYREVKLTRAEWLAQLYIRHLSPATPDKIFMHGKVRLGIEGCDNGDYNIYGLRRNPLTNRLELGQNDMLSKTFVEVNDRSEQIPQAFYSALKGDLMGNPYNDDAEDRNLLMIEDLGNEIHLRYTFMVVNPFGSHPNGNNIEVRAGWSTVYMRLPKRVPDKMHELPDTENNLLDQFMTDLYETNGELMHAILWGSQLGKEMLGRGPDGQMRIQNLQTTKELLVVLFPEHEQLRTIVNADGSYDPKVPGILSDFVFPRVKNNMWRKLFISQRDNQGMVRTVGARYGKPVHVDIPGLTERRGLEGSNRIVGQMQAMLFKYPKSLGKPKARNR